jgi:hypothetical protein
MSADPNAKTATMDLRKPIMPIPAAKAHAGSA